MQAEKEHQHINHADHTGRKMIIEFQESADLLEAGIIPFPIKKVEVQINDTINANLALGFFENLIRDFWCRGKLKTS